MTEADRIKSIQHNGGRHLKTFKKENITAEMCLVAVSNDGSAICFVPEQFRTQEVYNAACKSDGLILSKVPQEFINQTICEYAVSSNGLALEYVPSKYITSELCLLATSKNPLAFQRMPEKFITTEFVIKVINNFGCEAVASLPKSFKNGKFYLPLIAAIPELIWYLPKNGHTVAISRACIRAMGYKNTADAIKDYPEMLSQLHTSLYDHDTVLEFVNSELFTRVFKKDCSGFNTDADREKGLVYIDNKYEDTYSLCHILQWHDICEIVVRSHPRTIAFVNPALMTEELCQLAVENDGNALRWVPTEYRTLHICKTAFEKDQWIIDEIPEEFVTPEMALKAVKTSGYLLDNLPEQLRTREVCLIAMQTKGSMLKYVPKNVIDKEICLTALNHAGGSYIFEEIPKQLIDYEICLAAMRNNGCELGRVPKEFLTYELCLVAVKNGAMHVERIPDDCFTEELCMQLLKKSAYDFKHIPKDRLTERICLQALHFGDITTGTVLAEIPQNMLTKEMVDMAMEKSVWSLEYVPDIFVTEEMLLDVAHRAPGRVGDNFPERLRTKSFIERLIIECPDVERTLNCLKIVPLFDH